MITSPARIRRSALHAFRLRSVSEVDTEFTELLAETYRVGEQRHLR
jgi:hypothetical protein